MFFKMKREIKTSLDIKTENYHKKACIKGNTEDRSSGRSKINLNGKSEEQEEKIDERIKHINLNKH